MNKQCLLTAILALGLFACQKEKQINDPKATDIKQLVVDGNFNWNSARLYTLEITPYASSVLVIKDMDGKVLQTAFVMKDQVFTTQVQLPAYHKQVSVEFLGHFYSIPLTHQKIQYTLN